MGNRHRSVILLSGGLDSAANLALCHVHDEPVLALTADYGQRAARPEWEAAEALSRHYGVPHERVDLRWLGALGGSSLTQLEGEPVPRLTTDQLDDVAVTRESAKSVWVPNRNGVLISVAAAYAERLGATRLVVGFNREEAATFPDNSKDFLERATRALALSTANQVAVHCYTVELDKREIVERLIREAPGFPYESLWSCYLGEIRPCGLCESCRRLARALSFRQGGSQ